MPFSAIILYNLTVYANATKAEKVCGKYWRIFENIAGYFMGQVKVRSLIPPNISETISRNKKLQ